MTGTLEVMPSPVEAPSTLLCLRCGRACAPEHVGPVRALKRACKCWWCEHEWEEQT